MTIVSVAARSRGGAVHGPGPHAFACGLVDDGRDVIRRMELFERCTLTPEIGVGTGRDLGIWVFVLLSSSA